MKNMKIIKKTLFFLVLSLFSILLVSCKKHQTYTISYELDGGICESLITSFKEDETITLPTPSKKGYIFMGWYEVDIKIENLENKNHVLKAKWGEYEYETKRSQLQNGEYLVDGEFLLPVTDEKVPAVIIVGGSGPSDMDGTVNAQKPYKTLAIELAEKGIASIRFNKVTYQHAGDLVNDFSFAIQDEYLYAIESCLELLRENDNIDHGQIYLVGHSLGSVIIPIVLERDKDLAGGIIMAGSTMHILDLLLEQIKVQSEDLYNLYLPYCNYAKSLTEVPAGEEAYNYFGAYTAYYVSYNKINRELIKDLECPLLIIQGRLDLQVSMEHFYQYQDLLQNKQNVTYKVYDKLNHLFSNGENETLENAYKVNNKIDEAVIIDIFNFIYN